MYSHRNSATWRVWKPCTLVYKCQQVWAHNHSHLDHLHSHTGGTSVLGDKGPVVAEGLAIRKRDDEGAHTSPRPVGRAYIGMIAGNLVRLTLVRELIINVVPVGLDVPA